MLNYKYYEHIQIKQHNIKQNNLCGLKADKGKFRVIMDRCTDILVVFWQSLKIVGHTLTDIVVTDPTDM